MALLLGCGGSPPRDASSASDAEPGAPAPAAPDEPSGEGEGEQGAVLGTLADGDSGPDPAVLERAQMKQGTPKLKGGKLAAAEVTKVVGERADDLRGCYAKELSAHSDAHGAVTIDFTIDLYGSVTDLEASSDFSSEPMVDCVVDIFYKLAFARPDAPIQVKHSLTFSAKPAE
jgi:hypothetical protein